MRTPVVDREHMPVPEDTTELGAWELGVGAFPSRPYNPMPESITRLGEWELGVSPFPTRIPRLP